MSLLSHEELCDLVSAGVIRGVDVDAINAASIDLHLGPDLLVESSSVPQDKECIVRLAKKQSLRFEKIVLEKGGEYCMAPGEFLLAHTVEKFHLPHDISCLYVLKSTLARAGLEHLHAGWCDAGWNDSVLTMEFKNVTSRHRLVLQEGMRIGQMIFFRHSRVPMKASYAAKGSYNGQASAVATSGELPKGASAIGKSSIGLGPSAIASGGMSFDELISGA